MILDHHIQGIPCKIEVLTYFVQPPLGSSADSDMDCYGYTNIEYDVLDRNGRLAEWLERKLTDDDRSGIEQLIIAAHEQDDR